MGTRGKLKFRKSRRVEFDPVTTKDVENYIYDKFKAIRYQMINKGLKNVPKEKDINIELVSVQPGKRFAPFIMLMSTGIDETWNSKMQGTVDRGDETIEPIFDVRSEEDEGLFKVKLISDFAKLISEYCFTKEDAEMLMSRAGMADAGIERRSAIKHIMSFRRPVIDSKQNVIIIALDPIRVFHDMAKDEYYDEYKHNHKIHIEKFERMKDGSYRYTFSKKPANPQKGRNNGSNANQNFKNQLVNSMSDGKFRNNKDRNNNNRNRRRY